MRLQFVAAKHYSLQVQSIRYKQLNFSTYALLYEIFKIKMNTQLINFKSVQKVLVQQTKKNFQICTKFVYKPIQFHSL